MKNTKKKLAYTVIIGGGMGAILVNVYMIVIAGLLLGVFYDDLNSIKLW